jgi:hypothetical protein
LLVEKTKRAQTEILQSFPIPPILIDMPVAVASAADVVMVIAIVAVADISILTD